MDPGADQAHNGYGALVLSVIFPLFGSLTKEEATWHGVSVFVGGFRGS